MNMIDWSVNIVPLPTALEKVTCSAVHGMERLGIPHSVRSGTPERRQEAGTEIGTRGIGEDLAEDRHVGDDERDAGRK